MTRNLVTQIGSLIKDIYIYNQRVGCEWTTGILVASILQTLILSLKAARILVVSHVRLKKNDQNSCRCSRLN